MTVGSRVVNLCRRNRELREKYPIVKILAHNRLQECRRAFNQKESESSEIEIVQQERVKLSFITLSSAHCPVFSLSMQQYLVHVVCLMNDTKY